MALTGKVAIVTGGANGIVIRSRLPWARCATFWASMVRKSRSSALVGGSEWLARTMRINGASWMAIDNIGVQSYSCAVAGPCVYASTGFLLGNMD